MLSKLRVKSTEFLEKIIGNLEFWILWSFFSKIKNIYIKKNKTTVSFVFIKS